MPADMAYWQMEIDGWYAGPEADIDFTPWEQFQAALNETHSYTADGYQYIWNQIRTRQVGQFGGFDYFYVDQTAWLEGGNDQDHDFAGMIPSHLLTRENMADNGGGSEWANLMKDLGQDC